MKTGRNIIIGAIVALGGAAAVAPAVASAAPAVTASHATPSYLYHG